jgi:hypothetical protein
VSRLLCKAQAPRPLRHRFVAEAGDELTYAPASFVLYCDQRRPLASVATEGLGVGSGPSSTPGGPVPGSDRTIRLVKQELAPEVWGDTGSTC